MLFQSGNSFIVIKLTPCAIQKDAKIHTPMIKQKEICSTIFSSLSLLGTSHQLIQYSNSKMKTSHFIYGIMLTTIGILVTDNRYSKWHRAFRRPRENFNTVWTFLEILHISLLVIMLAYCNIIIIPIRWKKNHRILINWITKICLKFIASKLVRTISTFLTFCPNC